MKKLQLTAVLAIALAAMGSGVASAKLMANVVNQPTRFSGSCCIYTGAPSLALTLSMVEAGGGPSSFSTATLLKVLTGSHFDAEVAKLTKQYGKDEVGQFLKTFDFVVADSLKIVGEKKIALPSQPSPDPKDGAALAGALWAAGQTGEGFNTEVMLDRLVSHPIHFKVMTDIDVKYGETADAQYHAILTTAMKDLAAAYHLNAMGQMQSM
ncbi:MAG: hypothetical protein JO104_10600 [Candidatus Eremiobacteraeota bacterium]|nr:hypothetical protein [Candidatus Eremiobacteraeota bacterium]